MPIIVLLLEVIQHLLSMTLSQLLMRAGSSVTEIELSVKYSTLDGLQSYLSRVKMQSKIHIVSHMTVALPRLEGCKMDLVQQCVISDKKMSTKRKPVFVTSLSLSCLQPQITTF